MFYAGTFYRHVWLKELGSWVAVDRVFNRDLSLLVFCTDLVIFPLPQRLSEPHTGATAILGYEVNAAAFDAFRILALVSPRSPSKPCCASRRLTVGIETPEAPASCSSDHPNKVRAASTRLIVALGTNARTKTR
jgi:hypothetical protein